MNFVYYYYAPSTAAACIFLVLFGLSSILHFYQLVYTRTWFMIPFLIGGICKFFIIVILLQLLTIGFGLEIISYIYFFIVETVGYIGRLLSSLQTPDFTRSPYIMQSTLILIAPALLAASVYMTLGRIIRMLDAQHCSLVTPRWLTTIFVCGDVVSFMMQAGG